MPLRWILGGAALLAGLVTLWLYLGRPIGTGDLRVIGEQVKEQAAALAAKTVELDQAQAAVRSLAAQIQKEQAQAQAERQRASQAEARAAALAGDRQGLEALV